MKFTRKQLAETLGVKIGDKIKVSGMVFEVTGDYTLVGEGDYPYGLFILIDQSFEVLSPNRKVGNLLCVDIEHCSDCPFRGICNTVRDRSTLYEILENSRVKKEDKELYDFLKARLDKEVE